MTPLRQGGIAAVTFAQGLALVPPLAVVLANEGAPQIALLLTALIAALFWEGLFTVLRKKPVTANGLTTALIAAILVPADLPLWQLAVALSLGVILAELIFGGRGFGFLSPATVSLALLLFSFPQTVLRPITPDLALATLPGALLLLAFGLLSWRAAASFIAALFAFIALTGGPLDPAATLTAISFALIFLICDPFAAATTNPGRWLYGALAGGLALVFAGGTIPPMAALISAALFAGIVAPLIDHLVVLADAERRRRRLG
ncbi:RnfABCDGE type electron transport complex subunit D [Aestuariibius sp. 2305UL40-4]|uniref:RnfABCDGE type electron transport complex subunit D n=1 Tax=Aestuariibius violaceus TaxID=3234132 RepID=UPI00345EEA4D